MFYFSSACQTITLLPTSIDRGSLNRTNVDACAVAQDCSTCRCRHHRMWLPRLQKSSRTIPRTQASRTTHRAAPVSRCRSMTSPTSHLLEQMTFLSHGCVRAQPQTARFEGMLRRRVARSDGSPIFRRASQEEPTSSSLHSQPSSESADRAHGSPRTVPGATHTVSTIATREGETCAGLCAFTSK